MDPIFNAPNTIKGIEVLFFEEAEVTKMKGGQPSFATFGPMSVLYVPHYNRFILQINDWRYPLLKRFSINSLSSGNYNLPGPNGATFNLKIAKPGQALGNLDSILEGMRKLEASPDDKLVRMQMKKPADTGAKEVITETIKQAVHKVQNKVATFKTGTKNLTSTKKRINLKDIKTKNFRKDAHSRIKKDFFKSSEKLTQEFNLRRKENANLNQARKFDELKKTSHASIFYIPQADLEESILKNKDIAQAPKTNLGGERIRERLPETKANIAPISEGMTHYQG